MNRSHRLRSAAAAILVLAAAPAAAEIVFRHALDNSPLEIKPRPGETETEAVKTFKETGNNPYDDQEEAIAQGKKLYDANCASCHLKDGTGRIGPSLVDDEVKRERADTDVGMFEVIYGGSAGAMQSFARRGMKQDDMLKIIAYVRSLEKT
jgi:cytochrome c-L